MGFSVALSKRSFLEYGIKILGLQELGISGQPKKNVPRYHGFGLRRQGTTALGNHRHGRFTQGHTHHGQQTIDMFLLC